MSEHEPLEPLQFDPAATTIKALIDLHEGEPWLMSEAGEYHTYAVNAFKKDGTQSQILVALQWPCRINGTDEKKIVQLLIHPDDARGLGEVIVHTCDWLDEVKRMSG